MSTTPQMAGKLGTIQCLRGIAVMMVVWVHAKEQFRAFGEYFASPIGANGVDLFFVISGFIMVYTTHGKSTTVGTFLWRRTARIVPLYWGGTLAMAIAALLVPHLLKSTTFDSAHLAASLLFLPWPSPTLGGQLFPVLVPGWSINYEMYFYAVFASTLMAPAKFRLIMLAVLLFSIQALSTFSSSPIAQFYSDPIILEFLAGAVIGYLHQHQRTPRGWAVGGIFIATGLLYWWFTNMNGSANRFTGAGIAASLVVMGACSQATRPGTAISLLQKIGDASFSIYIFHIFLLGLMRVAWTKAALPTEGATAAWAFLLTALIGNAAAGALIYRWIELPISKMANGVTHTNATSQRHRAEPNEN